MPVIFSAAEATTGLIYDGPLERVDVDEDQTSYAVGRVHALPEAYPLSSLILESTGEPLSDLYIRPYAVCQTPALLPRPEEEPPPQPAVSPPSTRTVAERGLNLVIEEVQRRGGLAVHTPERRGAGICSASKRPMDGN